MAHIYFQALSELCFAAPINSFYHSPLSMRSDASGFFMLRGASWRYWAHRLALQLRDSVAYLTRHAFAFWMQGFGKAPHHQQTQNRARQQYFLRSPLLPIQANGHVSGLNYSK